tara:strand:+ start:171 stop:587 length:417 start_codon:yes stop_codon:yes gene_type:complete
MTTDINQIKAQIDKCQVEMSAPHNEGYTRKFYEEQYHKLTALVNKLETEGDIVSKSERRIELEENFPESVFADGFDDAIIGWDGNSQSISYSYNKCLDILRERDGMSLEEAHEFMEYNVVSAYVGDCTPLFIHCYENI